MPKNPNLISSAWGGENLRVLTPAERQASMKNFSLNDEVFTLTGQPIMDTKGADIHTRTAAEIFGIPEDQVTPEQRVAAREINFGITYGVSNREGMTHKALRAESQIATFRAVYGGYMSARQLPAGTGDLYTDLAQLERRLLARQWEWAEARHPIRRSSPTVLAALAGFDTPEEV